MTTLCIILARAGSKGLPNKNALPVAGQPMLAWTIEHAMRARAVRHSVVSTDGDELKEIAHTHAIHVVDRPADLAHDTAPVDAAARHAVQAVEAERGAEYDAIVILYGNVPVRPVDLIDRAVAKLRDTGCDSVQSVCPVGKMHPYWMKRLVGQNEDELQPYVENTIHRRQDLPPVYMLDGGIIAVTRDSLFTQADDNPHAFLGHDRRAVITQPGQVVDVDTDLDRKLAQLILTGE